MGKNQGGPDNPVSDLNTTLQPPGTHGGLLKKTFTTTTPPPSHIPHHHPCPAFRKEKLPLPA